MQLGAAYAELPILLLAIYLGEMAYVNVTYVPALLASTRLIPSQSPWLPGYSSELTTPCSTGWTKQSEIFL